MCRMMACASGIPGDVVADAFLSMARGENSLNERNTSLGLVKHGDGWGAVLETRGHRVRVRSARPCWQDDAFSQVRSGSVRLLHARLASVSGLGAANAHPFSAEVDGETWFFCHNGTIRDLPDDGSRATDSERFFRRLAPLLSRWDPVAAFESVAAPLRDVTSLNSLLLGPKGLWAFCAWTDPTYRQYYTLVWADSPHGVIVASEPLAVPSTTWTPLENKSVLWIPTSAAGAPVTLLELRVGLTTAGE